MGGDVLEVRAVLEVGSDILVLGGAVSLFGGAVAVCSHPTLEVGRSMLGTFEVILDVC